MRNDESSNVPPPKPDRSTADQPVGDQPVVQRPTGLSGLLRFPQALIGVVAVVLVAGVALVVVPGKDKPTPDKATPVADATLAPSPTATPAPAATAVPSPTSTPAPSPTPASTLPGWKLTWSDEFDGPAGTPPNPAVWTHEIGDGTNNNNRGWGNNELEYYTDSTDNAAMDGNSNLVITVKKPDASSKLQCYYGPCQYTSARLISQKKVELTYGRIEARIQVPTGVGLWPAFWMLGNDIGTVGWPQSGEIDIMENIGKQPNRVFGTIHGPGYSGAGGKSKTYDMIDPIGNDYHIFAVEWEPDKITWFIDNIVYHIATPADIAPNQWVFNNKPYFIILNVAVGGNLGGTVNSKTPFPQTMKVDYVRQYQRDTTTSQP